MFAFRLPIRIPGIRPGGRTGRGRLRLAIDLNGYMCNVGGRIGGRPADADQVLARDVLAVAESLDVHGGIVVIDRDGAASKSGSLRPAGSWFRAASGHPLPVPQSRWQPEAGRSARIDPRL